MKKKNIIAVSVAAALMFALTACGGNNAEKEITSVTSESPDEPEEVTDDSSAEQETEEISEPEVVEESEVEEEPEVTEEPETAEESEAPEAEEPSAGAPDVSSAVEATTSTDAAPIAVGQWVKLSRYATEDETYHTVYVRVSKVTTSTDDAQYVQTAVDYNNANGSDWDQIDLSSEDFAVPEDVEWCVLDYDVYVPEEFPAPDYGMVEPTIDFSAVNVGGGGIPSADGTSTYIGLGTNFFELAVYPDDTVFEPGNTYSFQNLYTMVKGYQDYVFETSSYPDGTDSDHTSADVMYYGYFGNK